MEPTREVSSCHSMKLGRDWFSSDMGGLLTNV